jgi:hypothetical protein
MTFVGTSHISINSEAIFPSHSRIHNNPNLWRAVRLSYSENNSHSYMPDAALPLGFPPRADGHQMVDRSHMSNFSSPASFMTTSSVTTFFSARSAFNSPAHLFALNSPAYLSPFNSPEHRFEPIREDEPPDPELPVPIQQLHSDYYVTLHEQDLIQPFDKELNWSGKGQHVTFMPQEQVPLTALSHLGASNTATVDKVLCRRIPLARKMMRCNRRWTVADALREVYHLQNLRHSHIVQLVGTYVQGRNLAILMYPVADCHLGTFLEDTSDIRDGEYFQYKTRLCFLASTLSCLTSAVDHIHEHVTKHMDIKPQNLLVRKMFVFEESDDSSVWHVYIADVGLSRSFESQDHSQTDGPTSLTPRYCAPEVYNHEPRGRSADIFSLGCVFLEILTVYEGKDLQDFTDFRSSDSGDQSFHANLEKVQEWTDSFDGSTFNTTNVDLDLVHLVARMLKCTSHERPTAKQILSHFVSLPWFHVFKDRSCCQKPPEPYAVHTEAPFHLDGEVPIGTQN